MSPRIQMGVIHSEDSKQMSKNKYFFHWRAPGLTQNIFILNLLKNLTTMIIQRRNLASNVSANYIPDSF